MCLGPNGKLHPNAEIILAELRKFCHARRPEDVMNAAVSPSGVVDPIALGKATGRREVYDMLVQLLALDLETAVTLKDPTS